MQSLINLARMWVHVSIAVVRRIFKRLLLGPTLPSWTWRTDIIVAVASAVISFAATVRNDPWINRFGLTVNTPIPHSLKARVRIVTTRLGSHRTDEYIRLGETSDRATILYFHGGAYVYGNPGTHREHVARLVDATGTRALAPVYRLAPTHRFPAGVDDAVEAYRSLIASGVDPSTVIVAGDSAGGGLTLALLLSLREAGDVLPAGAVLFSPYTDLEHTGYTVVTNADTDYLPLSELSTPNIYYCEMGELTNPLVSPIHADLFGLPPMLILAGGAEMILSDSIRLKENADRDGVDATLVIEPEMMHVWPAIAPWQPQSKAALATVNQWILDLTSDI
jgi:acetyl esterase/lipase